MGESTLEQFRVLLRGKLWMAPQTWVNVVLQKAQ